MMVLLRRRAALPKQPAMASARMNPIFRIEKIDVILHPLDMVSVAVEQLGERIGSLAEHGQAIADALNELLSRALRCTHQAKRRASVDMIESTLIQCSSFRLCFQDPVRAEFVGAPVPRCVNAVLRRAQGERVPR
jgi:hypothetical protein